MRMVDARRLSAGVGLRTTTFVFWVVGNLFVIGLVCGRAWASACTGLFHMTSGVGISVGTLGTGGALTPALGVSGGLSVAVVA